VGANANQTITAANGNFRTSNYGTNQLGAASYATSGQAITGLSTNQTSGTVVSGSGTKSLIVAGAGGIATINITSGDSAKSIASNINANGSTGVKATAQTNATLTFSGQAATTTYTMNVTGTNTSQVQITFSLSNTSNAQGLAAAVTAFNDQSAKTGITAKLNAGATGIDLTAADGSTITLENVSGASATSGSFAVSGTQNSGAVISGGIFTSIGGQLTLDSDKSYNISTSGAGLASGFVGAQMASGGSAVGSLQAIANLDISTVAGATAALRIADSALQAIGNQRAAYGALQSRFENTIANLQASSENLSAARSRIRDADFALETTNLTRGQILQQAGTAMLAQANSLPNQVLSLLRG